MPVDQAFKGYHYEVVSLTLPNPYLVRASGEKTTILAVRGVKLPIEEDLSIVLNPQEAPVSSEMMLKIRREGDNIGVQVSNNMIFHHLSNKPILRRAVRFIVYRTQLVRFSDHFGELQPKIDTYRDYTLYTVQFREPIRKGDTYVLRLAFNAFLGKGPDGAWYFMLDTMSDFDLNDVHILLSSTDLRFRTIQPTPVTNTGNNAELRFRTLEPNTRTTIRFEFE